MKTLQIIPLQSSAGVQLGWSRQEVHHQLGKPDRSFGPSDFFEQLFLKVDFDENDRVEFIEVSNPETEEVKVFFESVDLFNTEATKVVEKIEKRTGKFYDKNDPEIPYSFIFPELELSLWRPTLPENEVDEGGKYFETVGIGVKGYWGN